MKDGMNRPTYAPIFYFLSQYKGMYFAILVVTLAVSMLEGFGIAAFFPLFSTMLGDSSENAGGFAGIATKFSQVIPISSAFVAAAVFLIGIFLLKTTGILARDLLVAYVGAKIMYDVRKRIIEGYSNSEYQFMVDSQQGVLIYNVLSTPSSVSSLHLTLSKTVSSLMKTVAITVVLISLLPIPALAFIGLAVVYYLVIHYISKKVTYFLSLGRVKASTDQTVIANEFFNGFRNGRSLNYLFLGMPATVKSDVLFDCGVVDEGVLAYQTDAAQPRLVGQVLQRHPVHSDPAIRRLEEP